MRTVTLRHGEKLTVRFPVTAKHIKRGMPQNCRFCPVALALKDIFPGMRPEVAPIETALYDRTNRLVLTVRTPEEIIHFINAVDDAEAVLPERFEVEFTAFRDVEITYEDGR